MSFERPLLLLALLLIPALLLLALLRRRPKKLPWPSLLLWRQAMAGLPPRRRGLDPLVLAECSAVALLALGAAGPLLGAGAPSREVAILVDATAGEGTLRELGRLKAALAPADRVVESRAGPRELALAAAGLPDADLRVVATSRPDIGGPGLTVVGRARTGRNLGLDAVVVTGSEVWFAVRTDGEPEEVSVSGRRVRTGEGTTVPFTTPLEIETPDNYDGDDRIDLEPVRLGVRPTGARLADAALFRAGVPAEVGEDLLLVTEGGDPVEGEVSGAECLAAEGLFLEECRFTGVRAREGPGLVTFRGRALARWIDERTLFVGLPLDREWDEQGTLAVFLERAKRERVRAMARGRAVVGDAYASPAPGALDTRGVDRPFDGRLPEPRGGTGRGRPLLPLFAGLAAALLLLYLRAIVRPS